MLKIHQSNTLTVGKYRAMVYNGLEKCVEAEATWLEKLVKAHKELNEVRDLATLIHT